MSLQLVPPLKRARRGQHAPSCSLALEKRKGYGLTFDTSEVKYYGFEWNGIT